MCPMPACWKSEPGYDPNLEWDEADTEMRYSRPAWWDREETRLSRGRYADTYSKDAYRELPHDVQCGLPFLFFGHYPHISSANPSMIAFTESNDKGKRGIQTVMKPGRYLTKYYANHLSAPEIARLAGIISAETKPATILYARTREEIAHVYDHGPSSCMSQCRSDYHCPEDIHPCEVYAGPDTAVAYLLRDAAQRSSVTARAVVRLNEDGTPRAYVRLYGDERRLQDAFALAGIPRDTYALSGARLLFLPMDSDRRGGTAFVGPYLDGSCNYVDVVRCADAPNGRYLVVTGSGTYLLDNTTGAYGDYDDTARATCECCEGRFDEDHMHYTADDCSVCGNCLDAHYTRTNDGYYPNEQVVEVYSLTSYGTRRSRHVHCDALDHGEYIECALTGDMWDSDDCAPIVTNVGTTDRLAAVDASADDYTDEGEYAATYGIERSGDYAQDDDSGIYFPISFMVRLDNGDYVTPWSDEGRAILCPEAEEEEGDTATATFTNAPTVDDPRQDSFLERMTA